jgi:hypothetical protein
VQSWRSFAFFAIVLVATAPMLAACESDPDDGLPPFSEACDACLSREACAAQWDACSAIPECDAHVVCVLREQCYTEPSDSRCATDAGCALEEDAGEDALESSRDFEACARTECAEVCGFVEP